MISARPPGASTSGSAASKSSSAPSSSFTAIRSAWKVWVAGWILRFAASRLGSASRTACASVWVSWGPGPSTQARIARAMGPAKRSSP